MNKSSILWSHDKDYLYWCPGCGDAHTIPATLAPKQEKFWEFNGNFESPTFSPSVRHYCIIPEGEKNPGQRTTCHYFIQGGMIVYQNDCEHKLSGKTVPMENIPKDYGWY